MGKKTYTMKKCPNSISDWFGGSFTYNYRCVVEHTVFVNGVEVCPDDRIDSNSGGYLGANSFWNLHQYKKDNAVREIVVVCRRDYCEEDNEELNYSEDTYIYRKHSGFLRKGVKIQKMPKTTKIK